MGFVTQWGLEFKSVVIHVHEPGKKHVIHNSWKVLLEGQESQYTNIHKKVGPH